MHLVEALRQEIQGRAGRMQEVLVAFEGELSVLRQQFEALARVQQGAQEQERMDWEEAETALHEIPQQALAAKQKG